jgi:N-acetylmuramoyl-L-alanine amidase
VRNLRIISAVLITAGALSGCAGHLRENRPRIADWNQAEAAPTPGHEQSIPDAPSPVTPSNAGSFAVTVPTNETWVALRRWCESNGLPSPALLSINPVPTYGLSTSNGNFVFTPGSKLAHWHGIEVRLGFAPMIIDAQPFIHHLDLLKTVVPLIASGKPLCANAFPVMVIDPGHGGEDAGAKSAAEWSWEKDFTLDWARRVQTLLVARGWQVFVTRTNDSDLAISNRVAFASDHHADLFLSLHFNSAGTNHNQSGLETYCLTPTGMPSTITRGYVDDLHAQFPNNAFDSQNLQLAIALHDPLLEVNGHMDRGVRRARFLGVVRAQQRPAVLIEGGYLSNPSEARLIAQPAYRQKLAEAVVLGLCRATEVGRIQSSATGDSHAIQSVN